MFCSNCGTKLPDEAAFCSNCGIKIALLGNAKAGSGFDAEKAVKAINIGKKAVGVLGSLLGDDEEEAEDEADEDE